MWTRTDHRIIANVFIELVGDNLQYILRHVKEIKRGRVSFLMFSPEIKRQGHLFETFQECHVLWSRAEAILGLTLDAEGSLRPSIERRKRGAAIFWDAVRTHMIFVQP